jgi:hypothetical protein
MLHELRDVAARGPDKKVKVVRREDEREEFNSSEAYGAGQHPAYDLVRPIRRTEEQTPL